MTDLPLWAIWFAVVLLLSIATIPWTAQWRRNVPARHGAGGNPKEALSPQRESTRNSGAPGWVKSIGPAPGPTVSR